MNKRGQFYLIATLVIVGIIIGLATIYNSTKTSDEDVAVFDISSYLQYEGLQLVSSGIFKNLDNEEIVGQIKTILNASAQQNPNNDFIGIYGNDVSLTILVFTSPSVGSISLSTGQEPIIISQTDIPLELTETIPRPENGVVILSIDEEQYSFELRQGETLYMIVKKERGEENFVSPKG